MRHVRLTCSESDSDCCGVLVLSRFAHLGRSLTIGLPIVCCAALFTPSTSPAGRGTVSSDPYAACAPCHREIYERYRQTPMANASGPAIDGFLPADFPHAASGVHYRVFAQDGRVWLSYDRPNAPPGRELSGKEELRYFIGSGKRGRTYLFEREGYWFESPINWYGKKRVWDMAPNFISATEAPLTLPVDPGCLRCHASGVALPLRDARNHYASEPFAHGGIPCAACHGDASAHLASAGKEALPDIDRMPAARRDSVCLSCHLEGEAAVIRQGKDLAEFRAGDNLFDYAVFFVRAGEKGSGGRATSQWEALLRSECKRKSGDKLTCTTCHDPHGSPAPDERVAYYRQRCLQCHSQASFATSHHPENPDCTACHMARPPSNDIAHEQVTDHWIRKRVSQERLPLSTTEDFVAIGGLSASDRDLGLAYAQAAAEGDRGAALRAIDLLRRAALEPAAASDHELHAQLGFLEQLGGDSTAAAEEYRRALAADPYDPLAAGNLALVEVQRHNVGEAEQLWSQVFERDPVELGAGMNLAVVLCGSGQRDAALVTLDRLLRFAPDNDRARKMAVAVRSGRQSCISSQNPAPKSSQPSGVIVHGNAQVDD